MAEDASTFELDSEEEEHFTQVPNALIRDKSLSTDARWAASFVMSHARGFRVTVGTIRANGTTLSGNGWGKDRTYAAVSELMRAGYVRRVEEREAGRFIRFRYIIRKRPFPALPEAVAPDPVGPPRKNTSNHRTPAVDRASSSSKAVTKKDMEITDGMRRLCILLADHVEQMTNRRPPTITQDWLTACRRLLTLDDATEEQVAYVIRWVAQDDFWDGNILSMPTLRKQWPKLVAAIKSERRRAGRPLRRRHTPNGGTEVTFAELDAAIAYYTTEGNGNGTGASQDMAHGPGGMAEDRPPLQGALPAPAYPGRDS